MYIGHGKRFKPRTNLEILTDGYSKKASRCDDGMGEQEI